jgi:acylglycerol lipase
VGKRGNLTLASATEGTFRGAGDRQIFWRCWRAEDEPRGIVAIAHGWAEHGGRYQYVGERLAAEGYTVYALDHHGHGRSAGPRGRISFEAAIGDLDQLILLGESRHPQADAFLLGHSMGGALALRYALEHGHRLAGLIVSGPLIQVEGRAVVRTLARGLAAVAPSLTVAKVDPGLISRDPAVVAAYVEDPLVFHGGVSAGAAAEFIKHAATLPDVVHHVTLPALVMYGTADRICDPAGARLVATRLGSPDLTATAYDGLYHEILNEPERDRVIGDLIGWLGARATPPA